MNTSSFSLGVTRNFCSFQVTHVSVGWNPILKQNLLKPANRGSGENALFMSLDFPVLNIVESVKLPFNSKVPKLPLQKLLPTKFRRSRVPTQDSLLRLILKVSALSWVKARFWNRKIVFSRSTNTSPVHLFYLS